MRSRYTTYDRRVFTRSQMAAAIFLALLPLVALMQGFWVARHKRPDKPFFFRFSTEKIECPYCSGSGTVRDENNPDVVVVCPICFGVGGNYVRKLDKQKELLCPACVGMGRIYDVDTGYARGCMRCAGRGLIEISPGLRYPDTLSYMDVETAASHDGSAGHQPDNQ